MGRPKAWLPIGRETLLQRVVRIVSTRASLIIVSAAEGQSLPELPRSVEVVRDPAPDLGPLQGLSAGLDAIDGRVAWAFATATDVPLLEPRWMDRLLEYADGVDLVLPSVGGHSHPLAALYRPEAASRAASALLFSGERRLQLLRNSLRTRIVTPEELTDIDPNFLTLRNINNPEDYDALMRSLGADRSSSADPGTEMLDHPGQDQTEERHRLQ